MEKYTPENLAQKYLYLSNEQLGWWSSFLTFINPLSAQSAQSLRCPTFACCIISKMAVMVLIEQNGNAQRAAFVLLSLWSCWGVLQVLSAEQGLQLPFQLWNSLRFSHFPNWIQLQSWGTTSHPWYIEFSGLSSWEMGLGAHMKRSVLCCAFLESLCILK